MVIFGYFIQQQRVFDSPEICILCSTMKLYDCVRVTVYTYIQVGGFSHTQSKRKATALVKRRPRIGYVQVRGGSILISACILLSVRYSRVSISHFLK